MLLFGGTQADMEIGNGEKKPSKKKVKMALGPDGLPL
jgi:hypothetical protein